jgi:CelD/BcsL family acetyltransferase involved in cellulose biosynthesis
LISRINPLQDPRWPRLVERHPLASVFHSVAWLKALQQTYGYEPIVFTSSLDTEELIDGIVSCSVRSWITGNRLVSLPFSDHCDPLIDEPEALIQAIAAANAYVRERRWLYFEMRPLNRLSCEDSSPQFGELYVHHQLDLTPPLESLFKHFHKDSTQRKIRRAEREDIVCKEGTSDALLSAFYSMFLITRRRHNIPPQPMRWFRNLIDSFKEALRIRVAFKDVQPVAAILTLQHKNTLTYKYGCSDASMNKFGGTQILFWKAIEEAKRLGLTQFDLGRSDAKHAGLITFKDRWGASRSDISYLRYYASGKAGSRSTMTVGGWKLRVAKHIFAHSPDKLLGAVGSLFYRHVG